jgi:predicted  nucleic acid-binding Zn-ribbon protein
VVADASDGTCSGCLMTIRPALMQQIRSDANTIFRCESCHRLLVYNPPR